MKSGRSLPDAAKARSKKEVSRRQVLLFVGALGLILFWRVLLREIPELATPKDVKYTTSLGISIRETQHTLVKRIPRIIHQTYKTQKLSRQQKTLKASWMKFNPTWEYRFYDDDQCRALVAEYFPQWLDAYKALPMPVERADFFRLLLT